MKVLFLSSEIAPFSRTGGLGDVAGSLPKALKLLGHEVRVVTPCYRTVKERKYGLRDVARLKDLPIQIADKTIECSVKSGFIPGSKVQTYFIYEPNLYHRKGLYTDSKTGEDFPDNYFRFAFFNHVALQLMADLNWIPDIIHCNDWQSSLTPYLIRRNEFYKDIFESTRTILHLHNVGYQGLFPPEFAEEIGIDPKEVKPGGLFEFYEKLSFLKGGVATADILVTVSPTYAEEICSDEQVGGGLIGLYEERKTMLYGVLNGVNMDVWNPRYDEHVVAKYPIDEEDEQVTTQQGKAENKADLQEQLELPIEPDIPIVAMITRLTEQKGLDLLEQVADKLLSLPIQLVFLGVGEKRYEEMITKWAEQYPRHVSTTIKFDNKLSHKIESGADIYLMPSRYEPCGLNQMYSLIYGTVPVVRKTGGLTDSVEQYTTGSGNGFVFEEYDGDEMLKALQKAIDLYHQKPEWDALQLRGMSTDFSLERSANRFQELYKVALSREPYLTSD